jgi:serine/threonine protein kinase
VGGLDSFVGMDLSATYHVVRQIARGGMGAIYEATHLRLPGKRYAIKVLAPRHAQNPEVLLRFRQEAEIASRLGHEHIVEVHDFNFADDVAFLVMELLDGEDLGARLARVGPLAPDLVHHLLVQVTSALDAAHRARIVHRDLKPQNIFLCRRDGRDDYVKVLDFGISKVLDSVTIATKHDIVMGTPFYMAPEQAQGRIGEIDPRVDVFALGAILWEALTGQVAFDAPTLSAALYKVCLFEPPDVHLVRPELPPALSAVLRRALAKQREARTPGVIDLAREFSVALGLVPPAQQSAPAGASPAGSPGRSAQAPAIAPSSGTVASLPPSPPPSSLYLSASPHVPVRAGTGAGRPPASASVSPDAARSLAWAPTSNRGSAVVAPQPDPPDDREVPSRETGSVVVAPSRRGAVIALGVAGAAATLMVVIALVVTRARTPSAAARAGQHQPPTTQPVVAPAAAAPRIIAPPTTPSPAPPATPSPAPPAVAPASTEISLVFEVAPPDAVTSLQLDGVAVLDRRAHRTASPKHVVVTASARGFLPFRSEVIADRDQIVAVALRRAPAKVVRPTPRPGRASQAAASPAAPAPPAIRPAPEVPPPPAHGVASAPAGPEAVPATRPSPPISQPVPVQPQPVPVQPQPVQPQPVPVQPQPVPPPAAKKTGTVFDQ